MVNLNIPLAVEVINYGKLRNTFRKANESCMNDFLGRYTSYNDISEVVGNCLDMGYEIIRKSIDEHISVLLENGVYEVDSDSFFSQLFFKYSEWEKHFDLINDKYMDIVLSEEEKDRYRTQRRQSREKIAAAGSNLVNITNLDFGRAIDHTIDSAKAVAVNAVTNVAHGVFNLGAKAISSIGAALDKKELFDSPQTIETFKQGMKHDLDLISEITFHIIASSEAASMIKIPTPDAIQKARSMLNNSEKITDVNTKTDVIMKAIQIYPFDSDAYIKLAEIDLDYIFNLVQYSNVLCLNLTDVFHSFISKLIKQSKNDEELQHYANIASKFNEYYRDENFSELQKVIEAQIQPELQSIYEKANKNTEEELIALKNTLLEKIKVFNMDSCKIVETIDKDIEKEKIKGELVSVNMLSSKTELENRISELENKGFDRDAIQEQLDGHFIVSNVLKNSVLKNIFNFKGRASRKEFWPAFFKFNILAFIVSVIVGNVCRNESVGATISFIAFLIAFCLLLSVAVRRLHDAGFSGYVMIPLFIIYPLQPVLWILLSLSSKGDNKYGPKPKI